MAGRAPSACVRHQDPGRREGEIQRHKRQLLSKRKVRWNCVTANIFPFENACQLGASKFARIRSEILLQPRWRRTWSATCRRGQLRVLSSGSSGWIDWTGRTAGTGRRLASGMDSSGVCDEEAANGGDGGGEHGGEHGGEGKRW